MARVAVGFSAAIARLATKIIRYAKRPRAPCRSIRRIILCAKVCWDSGLNEAAGAAVKGRSQ